jgi:hypothetical protein
MTKHPRRLGNLQSRSALHSTPHKKQVSSLHQNVSHETWTNHSFYLQSADFCSGQGYWTHKDCQIIYPKIASLDDYHITFQFCAVHMSAGVIFPA